MSSKAVFPEPTGPPTPILTQAFGMWTTSLLLPSPLLGEGQDRGSEAQPPPVSSLLGGGYRWRLPYNIASTTKQPTVQCFVLHGANVELRSCAGQIIPALLVNVISDDREM